jgi:hypothetical protein
MSNANNSKFEIQFVNLVSNAYKEQRDVFLPSEYSRFDRQLKDTKVTNALNDIDKLNRLVEAFVPFKGFSAYNKNIVIDGMSAVPEIKKELDATISNLSSVERHIKNIGIEQYLLTFKQCEYNIWLPRYTQVDKNYLAELFISKLEQAVKQERDVTLNNENAVGILKSLKDTIVSELSFANKDTRPIVLPIIIGQLKEMREYQIYEFNLGL